MGLPIRWLLVPEAASARDAARGGTKPPDPTRSRPTPVAPLAEGVPAPAWSERLATTPRGIGVGAILRLGGGRAV